MDNQFNDDELQKAIDDITKDAASGGSSSVVDDLVKKNEESAPAGKVVSASTDMDDEQPAFGPAPEVPVPPVTDMNVPGADAPADVAGPAIPGPEVAAPEAPAESAKPEEEPKAEETSAASEAPAAEPAPAGDFKSTREEALKALYPLMDKVKIDDPVQKFGMYKEMFGLMKNEEVAGSVLKAAEDIPDEQAKADALMGLIQTIDELK